MENENRFSFEKELSSIKRVEANPYLITRIRETLKEKEYASGRLIWALGLVFTLVLILNIMGFSSVENQPQEAASSELNYMIPQNGIYE